MGKIAKRSNVLTAVWTWTVPPLLFAAAVGVARLSIELAPGEVPGQKSVFSTQALDLVLYALALAGCAACLRWPATALLTAGGQIAALWHFSQLYLDSSTDPLGGMIYLLTAPLALVCAVSGIVGFFFVWPRQPSAATTQPSGAARQ